MKTNGNCIEFKSTPDNFYKERDGLKCCTIRHVSLWSEMKAFEEFLSYYNDENCFMYKNHSPQIKIINTIAREEFVRTISDISEFEGLWLICWKGE